jgi:hypothetical protein
MCDQISFASTIATVAPFSTTALLPQSATSAFADVEARSWPVTDANRHRWARPEATAARAQVSEGRPGRQRAPDLAPHLSEYVLRCKP